MSDGGAWLFLIGRVIFAVFFFVVAGPGHILRGQMMVGYAHQMNFPVAALASWPAGIWLVVGGLSVALGAWGDVGAAMLALFVILAGLGFHRFWTVEDQQQKQTQMQLFWRNVSFLGAAVMLFAVYTTVGHDLALTLSDPLFDLRE